MRDLRVHPDLEHFAVREIKSDGSREVTYADTGYAASGTIEVLDGAYPQFIASTRVSTFTGSGGPMEFTSGAIDARPGINNNAALHTIAVYNNNFQGAFKVQGTMASSPSYNPNSFVHGIDKKYWNELISNEKKPLNNKSIAAVSYTHLTLPTKRIV